MQYRQEKAKSKMKDNSGKFIVLLHIVLMVYSLFGIFSKYAAQEDFLSPKYIMYYGIVLINLGFYAICWQQIIKRIPLVVAYANKAVTVVWGILFGYLLLGEKVTITKVVGALFVIMGVVMVVMDKEQND